MIDSLFVRRRRRTAVVAPTVLSTGPWSETSLHGGPVAALLAHALESVPTTEPMFPARFTLELLRAVGHEPMRIDTRVVRGGRKVQVLEATLARDPESEPTARDDRRPRHVAADPLGRPSRFPRVSRRRTAPIPLPRRPNRSRRQDARFGNETLRFHTDAVQHRGAANFLATDGPALDWIRVTAPLLPDVDLSPFMRVAAAADFGNGISRVLPFGRYLFVNPDLTIPSSACRSTTGSASTRSPGSTPAAAGGRRRARRGRAVGPQRSHSAAPSRAC